MKLETKSQRRGDVVSRDEAYWRKWMVDKQTVEELVIIQFGDGECLEAEKFTGSPVRGGCPDCGAKVGHYHDINLNCDNEKCPRCRMQFIGCDCDVVHKLRLSWAPPQPPPQRKPDFTRFAEMIGVGK